MSPVSLMRSSDTTSSPFASCDVDVQLTCRTVSEDIRPAPGSPSLEESARRTSTTRSSGPPLHEWQNRDS